LGAAILLASAACGGAAVATQAPSVGSATRAPSPVAATTSPEPSPTPAPPLMTGDATTNPACQLATVEEIESQVRAGVREIKGLTSPGAYAPNSLTCAWYLDSTDIGIPSVVLQWEFPVDSFHDPVVDLYESVVDQGLATAIDGVGDMAILQRGTAEAIAGTNIVRVSVLQHVEPTETDKQDAVTLLRLFLERTAPP
jgi:hypothetical protein